MTIQLTELQYQVLILLAEGDSNSSIATKTMREYNHIRKIVMRLYGKFGLEGSLVNKRVMLAVKYNRGELGISIKVLP